MKQTSKSAKCDPAYRIVHRLGGDLTVARALRIRRDAVWRWHAPPDRQGYGGRIPKKRWEALIQYARQHGVSLTEDDLTAP
jgi:hypothetical protein